MLPNDPEKMFAEADDELLSSLRSALRPEPPSSALAERIRREWDRRGAGPRILRLPRPLWLGLAAAAAVTLAFFIPTTTTTTKAPEIAATIKLTDNEASAIVQALAVMDWDGPVEYSLDLVDASLGDLQATLSPDSSRDGTSSWIAGDDWDTPPS